MASPFVNFASKSTANPADLDAELSAARNVVLDARRFGVVGDFSGTTGTNNRVKLQDAISEAYGIGNAIVMMPPTPAMVDGTIEIPQGVTLAMPNPRSGAEYVDGYARPAGGCIVAAPGMNADVVRITCWIEYSGGVPYDLGKGTRNPTFRHGGGIRDGGMVWGLRSTSADPSVANLNTSGNCISVEGARDVVLHDVMAMFGAGHGLVCKGRMYDGATLIGVNRLKADRFSALSNHVYGVSADIADSDINGMQAGFNGSTGMVLTLAATTLNGGSAWNNGADGMYFGPTVPHNLSIASNIRSYDNNECGIILAGGGSGWVVPAIRNAMISGSGRNSSVAATRRAGLKVTQNTYNAVIDGVSIAAHDQAGNITGQYGFYIDNPVVPLIWGASNQSIGAAVNNYHFASTVNIQGHLGGRHPGVTFGGDVDMASYALRQVAKLSLSAGITVTSIDSNTLVVSPSNSSYTLNFPAAQTITAMSHSESGMPMVFLHNISPYPVTLENGANLRVGGQPVVLNQYDAAFLLARSNGVFGVMGLSL